MIKVKINTEDELIEFAERALQIIVNMRRWQLIKPDKYVTPATKDQRNRYWQTKADELISEMVLSKDPDGNEKIMLVKNEPK